MRTALRPAQVDDFDYCARLYFSGMEETIRTLKLDMAAQTAHLRARWNVTEVRIITSDGADVGWMQSSIQDHALYLEQIFINAASQRRGIGTATIHGLIDQAAQSGLPVTLGVVKTNPALRLYERLGFRIAHEDDRKFYMRRVPDHDAGPELRVREEFPPLHSITSSAVNCSLAGTSRPSALAVFRLITISNLVGCSTGKSAGFSPLRIRPA
jgi:GNAT superfamily N-acetyltransferase